MPFCVETAGLSKGTSPCACGTGGTITASPLASSTAPGVACGSPARRWRPLSGGFFSPRSNFSAWLSVSQRPSLVMPIGTTSYFCLSMALRTDAAESRETSCSPLRPPKSIPTLSFFITNTVKEHSAVSNQLSPQSRAERGIPIDIDITLSIDITIYLVEVNADLKHNCYCRDPSLRSRFQKNLPANCYRHCLTISHTASASLPSRCFSSSASSDFALACGSALMIAL